ncbi:ankyrin [Morchella conica CCBAS932]|uniref:Ankyrin n=1 Tax=Morchella conica CCBAS932 TaxID=1392247 RepID=A0A3N4KB42_9PEZI|nr:ankyrin [Morchella conica CCBAS932]
MSDSEDSNYAQLSSEMDSDEEDTSDCESICLGEKISNEKVDLEPVVTFGRVQRSEMYKDSEAEVSDNAYIPPSVDNQRVLDTDMIKDNPAYPGNKRHRDHRTIPMARIDTAQLTQLAISEARIEINPSDPQLHGLPLLIAVAEGDHTKVKGLLAQGAKINQCHPISGHYALQLAASKGDLGMVDILLSHGAVKYKCQPVTGDFIIKSAIIGGNPAIVNMLSETRSSLVNIDSELNALHYAIELNKESIVDLFLDTAAERGEGDQTQITTALHQAILLRHVDIIANLLRRGGDWENTDALFGGYTLLCIAVSCADSFVVLKLLEAGAYAKEPKHIRDSLEHNAEVGGDLEIYNLLRAERVEIGHCDIGYVWNYSCIRDDS